MSVEYLPSAMNLDLSPKASAMFLTAEHQYMYLSSSTVKELGHYNVDLSDFLPR